MNSEKFKPILQKYRLAVIAMFVFFALFWIRGMLGLDLVGLVLNSEKYNYYGPDIYLIIGSMVVLALFLNKYLSSDGEDTNSTNINIENYSNKEQIDEVIEKSKYKFEFEIRKLQEEIERTKKELVRKTGDALTNEQRDNLIATLKAKITEASSKEFLEDLQEKASRLLSQETTERLQAHFNRTIKRLTSEITVLEKRSRVNLIIGSLTAFAGVSIFMLFVFEKTGDTTAQAYLVTEFAPRISLVIVIELFAYFFLGLYKSNLSEIKHFHNELTNVEHKYMALEESLASADMDTVKEIVKDLAKTERNFLLKKGESTVSLEDRRYALEEQKGVISALVGKLSKDK